MESPEGRPADGKTRTPRSIGPMLWPGDKGGLIAGAGARKMASSQLGRRIPPVPPIRPWSC